MMYRDEEQRRLAISQPAHAWISGQLMRRLDLALSETLLLAGAQHDVAWLDWERAPSFDEASGLPPNFRDVRAKVHAPMWVQGVERALAAWGPQVALLISRHGGRIYRRFGIASAGPEDAAAIADYLAEQAPREAEWAAACGLGGAELERASTLIAFVDALSLAVCGALRAPATLELPGAAVSLTQRAPWSLALTPWPFRGEAFVVEGEGRLLPAPGRFADAAAMRVWLASPQRAAFATQLAPG